MRAHLMYHPAGATSAKLLATTLDIPISQDGPQEKPDTLIRYGTYAPSRFKPRYYTINSRNALMARGERHDMLTTMAAAGVATPTFFTSRDEVPVDEHGFTLSPTMVRTYPRDGTQPHRGSGIEILGVGSTVPMHGDLFLSILPKTHQYRVHCLLGFTRTHELVPEREEVKRRVVWNDDGPFSFIHTPTPPPAIPAMALAAMASLSLQLGAVDLILTPEGDPIVLEVNTAPGISGMPGTLDWYTNILSPLCR